MDKKQSRLPIRYLLFLLSFFCLALLTMTFIYDGSYSAIKNKVDEVLMPIQSGLNKIGGSLSESVSFYLTLKEAQEENALLKDKIAELTEENLLLYQEVYEIDELRALLSLADQYESYETVAANVIQKESGNWFHEFVIDKGSEDGIFVGANVIANGALIGRVTYVGKHYARVLSIIADDSNVGAMTAETNDFCIVSGSLTLYADGILSFAYADKEAQIEVGNLLVTSNVSDVYLPGLAIGYVLSVELDANNLTQSGTIVPIADFSNIQKVLVITTKKVTEDSDEETTAAETVAE